MSGVCCAGPPVPETQSSTIAFVRLLATLGPLCSGSLLKLHPTSALHGSDSWDLKQVTRGILSSLGSVFLHVLYTLQNFYRTSGVPPIRSRLLDLARTSLVQGATGHPQCEKIARNLLGPPGQVPLVWKDQTIPTVARRPVFPGVG